MMGLKDGDRGSYPELVDVLTQHGAQAAADAHQLYRRMAFNVLVSNVDDHLRNHGFLWVGSGGWTLSPAYDLNPTPIDVRQRIRTTNINLDEGICDIDLVVSVAEYCTGTRHHLNRCDELAPRSSTNRAATAA
jgi:serine/threonine-protein kinase HipA